MKIQNLILLRYLNFRGEWSKVKWSEINNIWHCQEGDMISIQAKNILILGNTIIKIEFINKYKIKERLKLNETTNVIKYLE